MSDPVLATRVADIEAVIGARQQLAGWSHPVEILAVTKGQDADTVRRAADAGLTAVGENRVQEALAKQATCIDVPVSWHLIGRLQQNKVRRVVRRFVLIQSIDRLDLAEELDRRVAAEEVGRQAVLLQVNCSGEGQKGGVEPDDLEAMLDAVLRLAHLEVRGLMTLAAFTPDVREQRRAFALLRSLRERLAARGHVLPVLSMGMSDDYPIAVEEGATMIRLGTALFGARA